MLSAPQGGKWRFRK